MSQPTEPDPEGVNLLALVPAQVASWSEDGGKVLLELPAPEHSWRRPFAVLTYKIWNKKVRLDEVGSAAWKLFDGQRTVADVAQRLRAEFAERVEPAEERLGILVRMLHRGGLIAYQERDQAAQEGDSRS